MTEVNNATHAVNRTAEFLREMQKYLSTQRTTTRWMKKEVRRAERRLSKAVVRHELAEYYG